MITPMSRVTVLGPRRLQVAVVEAVQDLGVLHVDHVRPAEEGIRPQALGDTEEAARAAIDGVRTRAEAILALLPPLETAPIDTAPYATEAPSALRQRLETLEAQVKDLTRRLLDAEEEQEILRAYGPAIQVLAPFLALLEGSRSLEAIGFTVEGKDLGVLEPVRAELASATQGRAELVGRPVDDRHVGAVVAFARQDAEAVRAVLARMGVSEIRLPARVRGQPLAQAVPYLQERAASLPGEIEDLRGQLMRMSQTHRAEVTAIATVARDATHRYELMAQMPLSRYAFILHGWVPSRRVGAVRDGLRRIFGQDVMVYDEPAPVHHAEQVPVALDNPPWLRPFEMFLAIFDPPKYGTFDPTIVFAIAMPLWVGLIIGDIGYGLFLLAITLWIRGKALAGRPWRAVIAGLDFGFTLSPAVLRQIVAVLTWMTAYTFVFGIIFGEFFGNLPERFAPALANPWPAPWGPWHTFDRLKGIQVYLYLSVGFGLAQVYFGLVLEAVKAVRHRERREILETLALASGATAIFLWLGTQVHVLPARFFSPIMLGAVVIFLLSLLFSFSVGSLMWIMESISTFGAFISYARIFAVGMASLALAIVANTLGGIDAPARPFPLIVLGLLVGAVAHVLFFGLSILSHILQPARLNWVEFFSRFKYYQDTGHPYRPFKHTGGGTT
jgi:V/A-type H+/Na+-transporting ATPase subunit I